MKEASKQRAREIIDSVVASCGADPDPIQVFADLYTQLESAGLEAHALDIRGCAATDARAFLDALAAGHTNGQERRNGFPTARAICHVQPLPVVTVRARLERLAREGDDAARDELYRLDVREGRVQVITRRHEPPTTFALCGCGDGYGYGDGDGDGYGYGHGGGGYGYGYGYGWGGGYGDGWGEGRSL